MHQVKKVAMFLAVLTILVLVTVFGPITMISNAGYWEEPCNQQQQTTEEEQEVKEEATEGKTEPSEPKASTLARAKVMVKTPLVEAITVELAEEWTEFFVAKDITEMYLAEGEVYDMLTLGQRVEVSSLEANLEGCVKVRVNGVEGYIKESDLMKEEDFLAKYQYLLAQILYCEAGGVGKEEMELVGEVVLNRLVTTYWEFAKLHTLWDVLNQANQYPDTLRKIEGEIEPSEAAMEVAKELLLGMNEDKLPDNCFWQTGFYPTWNVRVIKQTEHHYYSVVGE